jgi:catechol 2,3-dioxygenase-like lactoylglutathione lyase family enzyme
VRLNHVMFAVADLDRSVGFYRSLGLRQIVSVDGYARFVSPEGDTTLSLESRDRDVHADGFSVHFDCDDVDATVAALKERGVEFEQDPTDRPYLWREPSSAIPTATPSSSSAPAKTGSGRPGSWTKTANCPCGLARR